jgi:hypothetical protein
MPQLESRRIKKGDLCFGIGIDAEYAVARCLRAARYDTELDSNQAIQQR